MKVAVIGGFGHLGRSVVRACIDRRTSFFFSYVKPRYNLLSPDETFNLFNEIEKEGCDTVINCCAVSGGITVFDSIPRSEIYGQNIIMGLNILREASRRPSIQKVVFPLSSCAYSPSSTQFREEDILCGEVHPSVEAIGASKRVLFRYAKMLSKEGDLKVVCPVLSTLYGPSGPYLAPKAKFLNSIAQKLVEAVKSGSKELVLFGTGEEIRDVVFEDDAANMILSVAEYYLDTELPINISGLYTKTIDEWITELRTRISEYDPNIWNVQVNFSGDSSGQHKKYLNIDKCRNLGYFEQSSLERSLSKTVDFAWEKF